MAKLVENITELIGDTPIVKLNKVVPENAAQVYVKLEFFNPASSVKDRIGLAMIESAEKTGALKKGDTIVEPTSGNTGIGLAMVAAAKGYAITIIMPDTMSVERQKLMKAYGADLILTPGAEGMKGAIAKASELAQQANYFMPMQFDNFSNPEVHEKTTGQEIIEAFGFDSLPDAFVAGVGTGGTLTGVSHALKKIKPEIKVYAVEPKESPVLAGGQPGPHKIQGIGAGFVPKVLDVKAYDEIIEVSSDDAIAMARRVAREEGILVGISAGAAIWAAIEVAKKMKKEQKIVVIDPDNGERYLSTTLYDA